MSFTIEIRKGKTWEIVADGCDLSDAARTIENWKSKFIDLKPTRYGFRLTCDFLEKMFEGDIAVFEEATETMRVTI